MDYSNECIGVRSRRAGGMISDLRGDAALGARISRRRVVMEEGTGKGVNQSW